MSCLWQQFTENRCINSQRIAAAITENCSRAMNGRLTSCQKIRIFFRLVQQPSIFLPGPVTYQQALARHKQNETLTHPRTLAHQRASRPHPTCSAASRTKAELRDSRSGSIFRVLLTMYLVAVNTPSCAEDILVNTAGHTTSRPGLSGSRPGASVPPGASNPSRSTSAMARLPARRAACSPLDAVAAQLPRHQRPCAEWADALPLVSRGASAH